MVFHPDGIAANRPEYLHTKKPNQIRQHLEYIIDINRALGNWNRIRIFITVAGHKKGIRTSQIAAKLNISLPTISKTLKLFMELSLVNNTIKKDESGISSIFFMTPHGCKIFSDFKVAEYQEYEKHMSKGRFIDLSDEDIILNRKLLDSSARSINDEDSLTILFKNNDTSVAGGYIGMSQHLLLKPVQNSVEPELEKHSGNIFGLKSLISLPDGQEE